MKLTKIPDHGSGIAEAKYGFLLYQCRYAHINLPTMRGLNVMMVMRVLVVQSAVHDGWQYTFTNDI
jgi:hypothetical protein